MRTIFYNKFFFSISISFFISYLLKEFVLKSQLSFVYTLSFFGALYLLLCWITYLKLDGVHFFQTKSGNSLTKKLDYRFLYKKKGVYNMDNDYDFTKNIELPENQKLKAVLFAYLLCSIVLFTFSHFFYNYLTQ